MHARCPEYLLLLACYLFPDGRTAAERDLQRLEAVIAMRALARAAR
jgi:hypothetical protein